MWVPVPDEVDSVITVWGVYFSGLMYIGPRLCHTNTSSFYPNSIILQMHGGYFTAPDCFLNPHPVTPRTLSIQLNAVNVKPSYSVNLLLRYDDDFFFYNLSSIYNVQMYLHFFSWQ